MYKPVVRKRCYTCRILRKEDEYWMVTRANGDRVKGTTCQVCVKSRRKQRDSFKRKEISETARLKTIERKRAVLKLFGDVCCICKGKFHSACMDFHHVKDDKNEKGVSYYLQSSLATAVKEANKCVLICANCHRFLHNEGKYVHKACISFEKNISLDEIKEYLIHSIRSLLDQFNTQACNNESTSGKTSTGS